MKICYIELGTNEPTDNNLSLARYYLSSAFDDIQFSTIYDTQSVDFIISCTFYNQTARIVTDLPKEIILQKLKAIEKRLGRMPEDKKKGIVKIDIDLLTYDGEVLKVNDWKREYVCQGVMELS